ncbi:Heat shock protein Hsp70, partial [human gut metagenome]
NLDEAVVNKILMPSLKEDYALSSYETTEWKKKALIDALKGPAEEMRIALSFADSADYSTYDRNLNLGQDDNGEEIDLEITINKDQLIDAVGEQYKKAVGICKKLLERNGLTGKDLSSLILVGGPTYSPIIRDMLKAEITANVDTSINPMTAVARGAALYASTIDANINEAEIKKKQSRKLCFCKLVIWACPFPRKPSLWTQ